MSIKEKIENVGIENCIFLVPMRPIRKYFGLISLRNSSNPEIIVPTIISEKQYELKDNYKITLKAIYDEFGEQHYYICDLESLVLNGTIEFLTKTTF